MDNSRRNLTLEEIGRIAGVSRSTVSRVVNDLPNVRPEIRTLVQSTIEKTGYLPNQAARALASRRTGLIGLVMPTGVDELFGDPYYSALVHGIQEGCSEVGSVFSIFPVYEKQGQTTVLSTLVAQGFVDGVIATAGQRSDDLISALRDRGTNVVVVGHPADSRNIRRVDVENRIGSAMAIEHLIGAGRERIAFLGPTAAHIYGTERLDGYRQALDSAGRTIEAGLIELQEPTVEGGYRGLVALLRHRPDAVHVATDTMALGALQALRDQGRTVPDDVAVVGFDGLPAALETSPSLTTIVQPVSDVGRTAVHLLLDDERASDVVILPTRLRLGASCGVSNPV